MRPGFHWWNFTWYNVYTQSISWTYGDFKTARLLGHARSIKHAILQHGFKQASG